MLFCRKPGSFDSCFVQAMEIWCTRINCRSSFSCSVVFIFFKGSVSFPFLCPCFIFNLWYCCKVLADFGFIFTYVEWKLKEMEISFDVVVNSVLTSVAVSFFVSYTQIFNQVWKLILCVCFLLLTSLSVSLSLPFPPSLAFSLLFSFLFFFGGELGLV